MTARRELYLKEMGLWPLWRRRGASGAAVEEDAEAAFQAQPAPAPAAPSKPAPSLDRPAAEPSTDGDDRRSRILQLDWPELQDAVAGCTACRLHQTRHNAVFGVGDRQADWLFVGEGPGAEEDAKGEPFVGQAGKLLDNMLASIGLARGKNVYIANVVKCRPPGNRNPEADERTACEPYLTRQIQLIRPKLIVALGKVAVTQLLDTDRPISALRGKIHQYQSIPLLVTYHPAYLLRNLPDKAKAWEDLCFAVDTMAGLQAGSSAAL